MDFLCRHVNRLTYPTKHILICEDDMSCQKAIIEKLSGMFGPQGNVQVSVVCGGLAGACVLKNTKVDLLILDHDMPEGNGPDLLNWIKQYYHQGVPTITFSEIDANNTTMSELGANYMFNKSQVLSGHADDIIKKHMGVSEKEFPEKDPVKEWEDNLENEDGGELMRLVALGNALCDECKKLRALLGEYKQDIGA